MGKYEEAMVMREFEVGVIRDAIVKAFGAGTVNFIVISITLDVQEESFSSGFQQVRRVACGRMKALSREINKNQEMNRLAAEMSVMVAMTDPLRQSLSSALESPARAASALENPMAAVNSILNEMNAIGGDVGATYKAMEAAALSWATGTASGSKLATSLSAGVRPSVSLQHAVGVASTRAGA
jgi:hypothetical protein